MPLTSSTSLAPAAYTPVAEIPKIVNELKLNFRAGVVRPVEARKCQLRQMLKIVNERSELLSDALYKDLHKHRSEARMMEIDYTRAEIIEALDQLDQWAGPERIAKQFPYFFDNAIIRKEPKGVVLIIAPWNYPVMLVLAPLIGALAAGNTVVLKPSEVAPHAASVITELITEYMDPSVVKVVNGGVKEVTALLEQRWDHIFYTGNGHVGQIVMTAAAKHLTPVTLELGGKSPCFVDKDSDLELAARRIAWGKCVNAGQTCVAPDYVLCHPSITKNLLTELRRSVTSLFGDDPHVSGRFAHIVNEHHYERLLSIFNSQLSSVSITADVVQVGDPNKHDLFFPFAAFKVHGSAADGFESVARENPAMRDENFGPILPIVEVERVEDGIDFVNSGPTPLALYVFSGNPSSKFVRTILDRTNSGGVCVNDTLMHLAVPGLPFGGVGPSGMGRYRGKHGFDAFSHDRAVLVRSQSRLVEAAMKLRYAPYTDRRTDLVKWLVFGIRNTELSWFGRVVTRYWWSVLKSTVVAAAYVAVGVTIGRRLA